MYSGHLVNLLLDFEALDCFIQSCNFSLGYLEFGMSNAILVMYSILATFCNTLDNVIGPLAS